MYAILLLFLVPAALAYSRGPPVANAGLCSDMIPTDHNGGVSLATDMDNPPYTITTSSDMYYAGGTVTVTIAGMGATMFKGFFIQARRTNLSMDTDEAIGTFSGAPNGTQLLECTVANSAWGHSNSDERTTVEATWNAPMQDEGPIMFKAIIVKGVPNRSHFYMNVTSDVMDFTQTPSTTPSSTASSVTVPLVLMTTIALGLAALLAARRQ
ncbi:putative defense protein 3 [Asterias rubens]|uniref:putative defense protein 3 n=1 Tax=Asterias rubens TaxID=7604 RepID=UPI000FEC9E53|nr:putative defense protein 3 [Asterias rubens]XP_033638307.1 putative defense protein 3 [Asterias rubens]